MGFKCRGEEPGFRPHRQRRHGNPHAIRADTIIPTISRADMADFMLKRLSDDTYLGKALGVMY